MNTKKNGPEKKTPLFSVITVVFNGAAHLEQAIKSVIDQTCSDFEYIVIDGGSDDGSLNIINKYREHFDYWVSEPDKGIYDAMNKGIARARGEFVGMLNADDWYEADFLKMMSQEIMSLQKHERKRVFYCNYYSHDESFSPPMKTAETSKLDYWRGMTISHQTMLVPRSAYQELGPYNLDYRFASDYEYLLRLLKNKMPFKGLGFFGINFRRGGASTTHMNRSISEVSRIVRTYFGIFSKEYMLFLMTNRLLSLLGIVRQILTRIIGKQAADQLRRKWRNTQKREN